MEGGIHRDAARGAGCGFSGGATFIGTAARAKLAENVVVEAPGGAFVGGRGLHRAGALRYALRAPRRFRRVPFAPSQPPQEPYPCPASVSARA